ncbi:PQQ-dependent sugar dehydrogenase [Longispora fulva]|uniref:PKD repeat protein n=1 Tax=Longispora fulva TaxID=619741 RepID=A0A8J7GTK6_9ACTN|nr:PQQ-dependent sugar dehydrogenase [Longispora fulva]MBG6138118.1 PKD repeat protein [Longispora fulva]
MIGVPVGAEPGQAATLPSGFQEQVVLSGLNKPTNIVFSPDGRIFVAEKGGVIKVFDSLADTTPDVFADLSTNVHDYTDRGLLGLAVPPNFPTNPYVYVLYSFDAAIGGTAPRWGDGCPNPPGTQDGCVISGRLSRLQASGNHMVGNEQVLLNDWCQQFFTHSVGSVEFGPDGALYVSGGDGASPTWADWGQAGYPAVNPCDDPPGGVGGVQTAPTAEGGALRSQSVRAVDRTHTPLGGTIIRIDPNTAQPLNDNPWYASGQDANTKRIVAYGLRNPYRLTFRPGTSEIWVGDVGWRTWEEINRVVNPKAAVPQNFGWPCYEGDNGGLHKTSGYASAGLNLCTSLYNTPNSTTRPYFAYNHADAVVPNDHCAIDGSSPTGLAFYTAGMGNYPSRYNGALFFADYARSCIWAMMPGAGGLPDPTKIELFDGGAATPTDLTVGPGGDLYYADIAGGTVRRVRYFSGNQPPTAAATATPTSGPAPLAVQFNGTGSSDPDVGDTLTYAWDFTNDGTVDATTASPTYTYTGTGSFTAKLTVTDTSGASNSTTVPISVGVGAPVAVIDTPDAALTWQVDDHITFSGHANSPQEGALPPSALKWELRLQHCVTDTSCHTHVLQNFTGVASGAFDAPDHDFPSHLELVLTATDSGGRSSTTSVTLQPKTTKLNFSTNPPGLTLSTVYGTEAAPFSQVVISGSHNTISAPSPQTLNGVTYTFTGWSDGGAQTHVATVPTTETTYTATFTAGAPAQQGLSGTVTIDGSGRPLPGATVTLNPGGVTTTTSATGGYSFDNVTSGNYGVTVTQGLGRCVTPHTASVTVSGTTTANVAVTALHDNAGYSCVDSTAGAYVPGTTVTPLTGDDAVQQVTLPFAFPFYGANYSTAWVDTNGMLSFTSMPSSVITRGAIPSGAAPNNGIYPFWTDLKMDTASALRTATVNGDFVLDWNNVYIYGYKSYRLNFEVILSPNGNIRFNYQYLDARASEQGGASTVGIESPDGSTAVQFSTADPVLRDTLTILFRRT